MSNPKLKLDREQFYSKLKSAVKFIPNKTVIPAFDNFMLTVRDNLIEILAADGAVQVRLRCPVVSTDQMALCLPAKYLVKIIGLFRENEVVITQKKENLVEIKSGKSKYNVTLDCFPKDFPVMSMAMVESEIAMNQFMLNLGLNQPEKFVNDENPNSNYQAINLNEIGNKIIFTGLEGHVICRGAIKPISINKWSSVSIPTVTAKKVASLLDDKGEIGVTHGAGKIMFFTDKASSDAFEVTSVLSDAKFPNSEAIIAKKPQTSFTINTLELKDAVKRLKLSALEESAATIVINNAENPQEFKLTCSDGLTGKDGEEIISIVNPSNAAFAKNFNGNVLSDILTCIDQSEIEVFFADPTNVPIFIVPKVTNEEQDIFIFVVQSVIV